MRTDRLYRGPRRGLTMLLTSALILSAAAMAWSHGLSVFAWVEGERVMVEGKFSGGKRPVGATVRVLDPGGRELLKGTTDAQGAWAFDLPQRTALKIVLEAGMGHQGEWTLSAEETGAETSAASEDAKPLPSPTATLATPAEATSVNAPTEDLDARLRTIVAEELAPITARLAHLEARLDGPSLQDILGGLGYILGLVGIGAYLQARRIRDKTSAPPRRTP